MNLKNSVLFTIPCLIWGSTWYAIKFQLGIVHPLLSVSYRFFIAGLVLILFCIIFRINLKFSFKQHMYIALQGISLFGLNYWMVYWAEMTLTSGLVAIIFSLIIFLNILFSAIFLKIKMKPDVAIGAVLGISGTALIFKNELRAFNFSDENFFALMLCLISIVLASLGNVISARNQKSNIPVIQTNAFGMTYGSIIVFFVAIILGVEIKFNLKFEYVSSLLYLAIFGSIVAFTAYLKLLGNIGPDRAAYTILIIPIIAMVISTIFEGYIWQKSAIFGIVLLITGNLFAMSKNFRLKRIKTWRS
ncbi:MAG: EamA family transporter [Bacteroidales bacterium]|nr:EamA family transporter [Bacteroidales bacterium]